MKPTDWIALLPALNHGWAFAAFVVLVLLWLYSRRHDNSANGAAAGMIGTGRANSSICGT